MTKYRHRISGPGPAGDIWVTTLHSSSILGDLAGVHAGFVTFAENFLNDTYKALCSPQFHATQLVTDQLDDVTGKNVAQLSQDISIVGTGAGATVSPRSCLIVSLKTIVPTRAGRGRMYFPSPDSSHYASTGEFTTAVTDTVSAGFVAALAALAAVSAPVIYHRATKGASGISEVRVGTIPGTQTRRTNKSINVYSSTPL